VRLTVDQLEPDQFHDLMKFLSQHPALMDSMLCWLLGYAPEEFTCALQLAGISLAAPGVLGPPGSQRVREQYLLNIGEAPA
jgi:hypothetical protein